MFDNKTIDEESMDFSIFVVFSIVSTDIPETKKRLFLAKRGLTNRSFTSNRIIYNHRKVAEVAENLYFNTILLL